MRFSSPKNKLLKPKAEQVFEIGWEVCNKVGGIYTVLTSKACQMLKIYQKERYCLIGPYFQDKVKGEFEEEAAPAQWQKVFTEIKTKQGIVCHFGKWLIESEPRVILVDFQPLWQKANQIKEQLWQDFQVDSLKAGHDFTEPVLFGAAVGMLLEEIAKRFREKRIVAHFHEWLSGAGLLRLKKNQVDIGLVFTTHATSLGRTLVFHWVDPYISDINPLEQAEKYDIKAKHQIEKASAENSDVFSTVSEITGLEASRFLGRKPDALLPNGLDTERLLCFDELILKHRLHRDRLKEFLLFYFFPYYTFDLTNTLFYFMTGRYEVKAKGIDVFIRALSLLNQRLNKSKSKKTIVAFLWVPSQVSRVRQELIENKQFLEDIKDSLAEVAPDTEERLLYALTEGRDFNEKALFDKNFLFTVRKKLVKLKRKGLPPLSTHLLADPNDYILKLLPEAGLFNRPEDRVKIVFYPIYLTGHDGLSNLNYQESIEACHLGAFPSLYEPWGYTPLETAGAGVPAVTTDAAGFGRYCQDLLSNKKQSGIFILKRFQRSEEQAVRDLADIFEQYAHYSKRQRLDNKIEARRIAALADWKSLINHYLEAHNKAVAKKFAL